MARKLVWSEGLFVTQHHLQQQDAYHEALLAERLRAALPFDWGVVDLLIDERGLAGAQLRVTRLDVVMPDGTCLRVGDGQADVVPPRSFESEFGATMPAFDVYLAIPNRVDGTPGIDLEGKGGGRTRYTREPTVIRDAVTGAGEQAIDFARPNLRLLFADERREGFDTLRIAQLVRSPTGHVVIRDSFVPPCFQIRASTFLMRGFRAVLTAMTARQRQLAETRRQRVANVVEFDAADATKFWFLSTLNAHIPPFAHLVDAGTAHPEQAYLALGQLIGQLCTFAADGDPTQIPKFNYFDLGSVFEPMFARALSLINASISDRFIEIPLTRREDNVFLGQAQAPEIMRSEFFLAVSGSLPEQQVRDRLPKLIKIASPYHIAAIMHSAVNGARIDVEYRPPSALPIKPGTTIFRVQRTPEFWPDIASTGAFAIYLPFDSRAVNLNLYAVEPNNL